MVTDALGTMNAQNPFAGWSYHAAGNLTAEPQKTYPYDAKKRMTQSIVSELTAT